MPPPRDVKVEVAVSATHLNEQGQRMPLAPKIVINPRHGGMVVDVDWSHVQGAPAPAAPITKAAERSAADAGQAVQQVQEWLTARIRQWTDRA